MGSGEHVAWKGLFLTLSIFQVCGLLVEDKCEHMLCVGAIFLFPLIENLWRRRILGPVMVSGYESTKKQISRDSSIKELK